MASAFLGLPIRVTLLDGRVVQGKLDAIDAALGTLQLDKVTLQLPSGRVTELSAHLVKRDTIKALELLEVAETEQNQTQDGYDNDPALNAPTPTLSRPANLLSSSIQTEKERNHSDTTPKRTTENLSGNTTVAKKRGGKRVRRASATARTRILLHESEADESGIAFEEDHQQNNSEAETAIAIAPTRHLLPPEPRKRKQKPRIESRSNSNSTQRIYQNQSEVEASAGTVSFDEDFDFARGLDSFDKKRIFQEIRDADDTDPALLLVSHNKRGNGDHRYTTKLGINENVLDDSEAEIPIRAPLTILRKSSARSVLPEAATVLSEASDDGDDANGLDRTVVLGRFYQTTQGIECPLLTSKQWKEIIQVANIETGAYKVSAFDPLRVAGPNLVQRIENGARGLAQYIIRGQFAEKARKVSSAVILCGISTKAQYGLRAGAQLVNKGLQVTAWLPSSDNLPASLEMQLRLFSAAGGKLVRAINDLPPKPDVIIDCLLENEVEPKIKRKSTVTEGEAAFYANANASYTISLDLPSGVDTDSGQLTGSWSIQPQCVVGLGGLKTGLGLLQPTQKTAIIDIGLPHAAYERVCSEWPRQIFGRDWLVEVQ